MTTYPTVQVFDEKKIKTLIKSSPRELQEYILALKHALAIQSDLTNSAIKKLRERHD